MELLPVVWLVSIIGSVVVANQKNLSGWYIFLSVITGPLGIILALLASAQPEKVNPNQIEELDDEVISLKINIENLQNRVAQLEKYVQKPADQQEITEETSKEETKSQQTVVPLNTSDLDEFKISPLDPTVDQSPEESQQPEFTSHQKAVTPKAIGKDFQKHSVSKEPSSAEINFGQFWLNKIGIVIFTLGIGFFISYSFQYFSPLLKDLLGYTVAGVLFYLGRKFEKQEKMQHYGLALMGAGWALTYFTTYALHHFDASRVIDNQFIDMCLLFVVAVGMMLHALKAKSETMMMVSLGVAYVTSLIGDVTTFTFLSSIILGCVVVFLLYHFQWIKTLFLGIGMTYGIHQFFIVPAIGHGRFVVDESGMSAPFLNLSFLSAYWVLYFLGTHIVKGQTDKEKNCVAAGNFINFILFFVMSSPVFLNYYPDRRILALMIMGCVYALSGIMARFLQRRWLYASDIVIAMFALTLAVYIKYLPYTGLMIWMIETPFILYAGLKFKDNILKYLSYGLCGLCLIRFISVFNWGTGQADMHIVGITLTMMELTALVGSVTMGICYWIHRNKGDVYPESTDAAKAFCGMAVFYLTAFIWSVMNGPWLTMYLFIEVPLLLLIGRNLKENVLKVAGHILTWICMLRLFIHLPFLYKSVNFEFMGLSLTSVEWTYFIGSIAMWFSFWIDYQKTKTSDKHPYASFPGHVYSGLAALLMTLWVCSILDDHWLTFGLTIEAVSLFFISMLFSMKRLRVYCYVLLALVVVRFIGIDDYHGLGVIKRFMILFEMATLFGMYFVTKQKREEDLSFFVDEAEPNGIFVGFLIVFLGSVFKYAVWGWRSLCLGVGGVGLILFGLWTRDKTSRIGGFILLGMSLCRIVFVDLARLPTIFKITSFIIIGGLLLGLSFMYNKYFVREKNE